MVGALLMDAVLWKCLTRLESDLCIFVMYSIPSSALGCAR